MATRKLTAKQIAAGFGGKRAQSAQKGRKRRQPSRRKLGYVKERKVAKSKRRRSSSRRGTVRRRVTRFAGRHKVDFAAAAVAAAYGYAQGTEQQLLTSIPVITPIGRAGTLALIGWGLAKFGIAPKYTSAIARGMTNIAVYNLGRRRFSMYNETEGRAIMSGADETLLVEGLQDEDMMGDDFDEVGAVMEYDEAA
jgi:hypothetical protein